MQTTFWPPISEIILAGEEPAFGTFKVSLGTQLDIKQTGS